MNTKGYKFRIYPTRAQERMLRETFGAVRWVYNQSLTLKRDTFSESKVSLSPKQLSRQLTEWKRHPDKQWLNNVPATCLVQSQRNLADAYTRFFKRQNKFPEFKDHKSNKSARYQDVVFRDGVLKLPKLGIIRVRWGNRELPTIPKMATVSMDRSGRFWVSFNVEFQPKLLPMTGKACGIDVGINSFATFDSGEKTNNPTFLRRKKKALRRSQRALARYQKESNRREQKRKKIATLHRKIADRRRDFLHKTSTQIVKDFDVICIEDLNVKQMLQSKKYANGIHDASWAEFRRLLSYKCDWYGKTLVPVPPQYTSRDCSECGERYPEKMHPKIRTWTCKSCGTKHDRDINAARNILNRGLKILLPAGSGKITNVDNVPLRHDFDHGASTLNEALSL